MDTIKDLQREIHQCAIDHGWWEDQRPFAELVALCHSELSEALEARRAGMADHFEFGGKPEGAAIEMACGTIGQAQAWADKAGQRIATRYYIVLPEGVASEAVKRKAIPAHIGIYGVTEDEEIVRVRNPQIKRRYD